MGVRRNLGGPRPQPPHKVDQVLLPDLVDEFLGTRLAELFDGQLVRPNGLPIFALRLEISEILIDCRIDS